MGNKKLYFILAIVIALAIGVGAIGGMLFVGGQGRLGRNGDQTMQQMGLSKEKQEDGEEENEKYVTQETNGTKVNNSDKLEETRKVANFEITDITLKSINNESNLLAQVKNVGTTDMEDITEVTITVLNENEEEIAKMQGIIAALKAGETTELNVWTGIDIANAYDIRIEPKI